MCSATPEDVQTTFAATPPNACPSVEDSPAEARGPAIVDAVKDKLIVTRFGVDEGRNATVMERASSACAARSITVAFLPGKSAVPTHCGLHK